MKTALLLLLFLTTVRADRPNILFLSIDDLKPELSAYGSAHVKTPHMDRIASDGVLFLRAYTQQAVCAPSRMSTFTGVRPDHTGVLDLQTDLRTSMPDAVTVQQYFRENGYITAGAGKIMHGSKDEDPPSWSVPYVHTPNLPYADGFAPPVLSHYQSPEVLEAWAQVEAQGIRGWRKERNAMKELQAMPPVEIMDVPDDAYKDGALASWGVQQLRQAAEQDQPFFLTLGFHKPHLPFVAPRKYWDLWDRNDIQLPENMERSEGSPEYAFSSWGELRNYSGIPGGYTHDITEDQKRELIHGYYACVAYVDAQVGRVLDVLEETGLNRNTIVVLWGDHGWHLGDHGLWCKHTNFEQATRIPLIISAPGGVAGVRIEGVVESLDLFPTLAELADLEVPDFTEGVSLAPVISGQQTGTKGFAISQYPRTHKNLMGYSMRTRDHRLTWWLKDNFNSRNGVFSRELVDAVELFDYQADPLEQRNRAEDPDCSEIRSRLEGYLQAFLEQQRRNAL